MLREITPPSRLKTRDGQQRLRIPVPPNGSPRWRQAAPFLALGAALLVLVVVAFALSKNYERIAEGQLLPYTEGEVAQVRFFDSFTLYIAREQPRLLDAFTTVALAMVSGIALFAFALASRRPMADPRARAFFLVCLLGTLFLAVDESMAIHETIGHNMRFLADLPGVHRPDDVIFASYIVPALIVLVLFRRLIFSSRGALAFFAAGLGLFVAAGVFDLIGIGVDELIEPLLGACFIGGFTTIALDQAT